MLWILHWIPDSILYIIIHAAIVIGAVGLLVASFLKLIPFINIYRIWIQLICVILLVGGIYWKGAYEIEMTWRKRVQDLEAKIQDAEKRAAQINTEIITVVETKVEKQIVYRDKIKKEIQIEKEYIDKDCKLNPTAVELYNKAIAGDKK